MASNAPQDGRVAGNVILDSVLTLAAFVVFFFICRSHVPSEEPMTINLWAAFTASCMAGVFWLSWQMFRVVFRGQREDARQR